VPKKKELTNTILFLRSPRRDPEGPRGHNQNNEYAKWRNPKRSLRRKLIEAGVDVRSGRAWRRYRKAATAAFLADKAARDAVGAQGTILDE